MNEHFLHFVWKNGLFDKKGLRTCNGDKLELIEPGSYNRDSGPDFLNARLKISGTEWAGNVEIHYRASSWFEHNHHKDNAYNNVILHVVIENNMTAITASGLSLDSLEIKINRGVVERYEKYMTDKSLIVCRDELHAIDSYYILHWVQTLAINRLERKTKRISVFLRQTNNNWEEVLYRLVTGNFGLNVNKVPFELLATKVPLKLIRKHSDDILQVEALLFGQAGMLDVDLFGGTCTDDYMSKLLQEYKVLKSKYRLRPMDVWQWKFHRMRPVNFPGRRISQLATLMSGTEGLFSLIKEALTISEISDLLFAEATEYWNTHYRFGSQASQVSLKTGRSVLDSLIINCIIPLLWLYGKNLREEKYCNRALDFFDSIKPENNRLTRIWSDIGIIIKSSLDSQGIIELSNEYCKNRMCLNCQIGTKLISLGKEFDPDNYLTLGEAL